MTIPGFGAITGHAPYPWQVRLYQSLLAGNLPSAADISTGGGKTTAVLLHMLALAHGAPLARRIAYVVDRRAVVDQTATVIRQWIERLADQPELKQRLDRLAAFPASSPVTLGVLRGGLADDGEWRVDPARPTVLVGTVDMVGSRLLFSGYGCGRSRRAMDAGLLGQDAVLYLDEAHLSPGFAGLVQQLSQQRHDGPRPGFRAMTLSATDAATGHVLRLDEDDVSHPELRRRLEAPKTLHLEYVADRAARLQRLVELATEQTGSIILYVRTVADATALYTALCKRLKDQVERIGLLTGTLRGFERDALMTSPVWQAFQPERVRTDESYWLIATAAGEVGVDLDADHAIMDLTCMDAMIQRLGRVNRTGRGSAQVFIVIDHAALEKSEKRLKNAERAPASSDAALMHTVRLLETLIDVSPVALRQIPADRLAVASEQRATPVPLHPETVQVLSLTATDVGFPIEPFLHGQRDEPETPDVYLCWRWDIPLLVAAGKAAAAEALALFRPEPRELARVPIHTAAELLNAAAKRHPALPLITRDARGQIEVHRLQPEEPLRTLAYATVFLPCEAGGLRNGLPDPKAAASVPDVADSDERLRVAPGDTTPPWMASATRLSLSIGDAEDDADESSAPELVYAVRRYDATLAGEDSEVTRFAPSPQTLDDHSRRVAAAARRIAQALQLPPEWVESLTAAGAGHDTGKRLRLWQRAAGLSGTPMAKARAGHFRPALLGRYRHECGSLIDAEQAECDALTLHLIAAHHGWARPGFPDPRHWGAELPSTLGAVAARAAAERFGQLQARFGPWQLAWFEALLKAADAFVSADRDSLNGLPAPEPGDDSSRSPPKVPTESELSGNGYEQLCLGF